VLVISYSYWQRRFGGNRVLGSTFPLNGAHFNIVGVAEPGFSVFL
jgi:hypothetical protein